MKLSYNGPSRVKAVVTTGPGPETLNSWTQQSQDQHGMVVLGDDFGKAKASLRADRLNDPSAWEGDSFTGSPGTLDLWAEVDSADKAGAAAAKALFPKGGDTRSYLIVMAGQAVDQKGESPACLIPLDEGGVGHGDVITVHVPLDQLNDAANWTEIS